MPYSDVYRARDLCRFATCLGRAMRDLPLSGFHSFNITEVRPSDLKVEFDERTKGAGVRSLKVIEVGMRMPRSTRRQQGYPIVLLRVVPQEPDQLSLITEVTYDVPGENKATKIYEFYRQLYCTLPAMSHATSAHWQSRDFESRMDEATTLAFYYEPVGDLYTAKVVVLPSGTIMRMFRGHLMVSTSPGVHLATGPALLEGIKAFHV